MLARSINSFLLNITTRLYGEYINMLDKIYSLLSEVKINNKYLYPIVYKFLKIYFNIVYIIKYKLKNSKKVGINDESNIIVSLTSFPARIDSVWITIETLLNQTYQPKKIILWLAENQFEDNMSLPKSLTRLIKRGLEIRFCDDLRSHKKYYYAMKEFGKNIIITVDDDIIYPSNLINNLYNTYKIFPSSICCNWSHQIIFDENKKLRKYDDWHDGSGILTVPRLDTIPIGYAGVLYPPNSLDNNIFNIEDIFELAPLADDIWLKAMSLKNNVSVVRTQQVQVPFFGVIGTQKVSLFKVNCMENENDKQINKINEKYPEIFTFNRINKEI